MRKLLNLLLLIPVLHFTPATAETIALNTNNTVVIRGEITGSTMVAAQLTLAKQVVKRGFRTYPIYIVLDSPGGSIEAGFMFTQFAKTISNLHTISIFSASMASAIVQELPGDRLVTENGTLMFHRAAAGVEGTVETGSLEAQLYYIKKRVLMLENANASRMRMRLADYKSLIVNELWLDSDDSVLYRAADRKVDIVCSGEMINKIETTTYFSIFGSVQFGFSACPLFRAPVTASEEKIKYEYGINAVKALTAKKGN